jgi:L-ornithine N5-oxygenase
MDAQQENPREHLTKREHTLANRDVELLAIGAGPSNLALAVAMEENAPGLARESLIIERHKEISWQRGMLLPHAMSQVSFLKDLVTLRNPRSRFSFINYLHDIGRLDQFVNISSFVPYRLELADYLRWTAESLQNVEVQLGRECADISPVWTDGTLTGWATRLSDGQTIRSQYLVIATGRDTYIPEPLRGLSAERVVHSTGYVQCLATLRKELPYRVVVVGGGQSAAELFHTVPSDLPESRVTLVTRSISLKNAQNSKFTNELFFPEYVDGFYDANPGARRFVLAEMHATNYGGLEAGLMDTLYRQLYFDRLSGQRRLQMITAHDVTAAREDGDEVVLELTDRRTGVTQELRTDLVLLGTGFSTDMPKMVRRVADSIGLSEINVTRDYRLAINQPSTAACYLQGINETTHGIADSLLSVIPHRANDILNDILAHRAAQLGTRAATEVPAQVAVTG